MIKEDWIVNPKQLEQATVKIICTGEDRELGTGFFITKNLIITAKHVIEQLFEEDAEILIETNFHDQKIKGELISKEDDDFDVALIQIDNEKTAFTIPLFNTPIRYGTNWETYGFPYQDEFTGERIKGTINKTNTQLDFDVELDAPNIDNEVSYEGLSGSALIVDGQAIGIIIEQTDYGFGAMSVRKVSSFLDKYNIGYKKAEKVDDIPYQLQEEIEKTTPNYQTLDELNEKLHEGSNYYLLHGSPGSGKTMITASFSLENEKIEILGRYFINIPNDDKPMSYWASKETLLGWLEDLISVKLSGQLSPVKNLKLDKRIAQFTRSINSLNEFYKNRNQVGFIIIDGLDGVDDLNDFMSILPQTLPSNVSILLSATRKEIIPTSIKAKIQDEHQVEVSPLEENQCLNLLREELEREEIELTYLNLQQLAEKSEGHPLYLRYLLELLKNNPKGEIDKWIGSLPSIKGDIKIYYNRIWDTDFKDDAEKLWSALTISQLRQPVEEEVLLRMLDKNVADTFISKFPSIKHLFKTATSLSTYHNSFNLFIEEKAKSYLSKTHDNIFNYCSSFDKEEYSITNVVYHKTQSSSPLKAVQLCNQNWVDSCAMISVEPDLVLQDIQLIEIICIDNGLVTELIRIKLLLQRIQFRYNYVLAENAFHIAELLITLGKPRYALRYILRNKLLLVADEDAIQFLQRLYDLEYFDEAKILSDVLSKRYLYFFNKEVKEGYTSFKTFNLLLKQITLSSNEDFNHAHSRFLHGLSLIKRMQNAEPKNQKEAKSIHNFRAVLVAWYRAYIFWKFDIYTTIQEVEETYSNIDVDKTLTKLHALVKIYSDEFKSNSKSIIPEKNTSKIIDDIEYAIENYGYYDEDVEFLILALLDKSRNVLLVKSLMLKYLEVTNTVNFQLRKSNGVDADYSQISELINIHIYKGYIDEGNNYPIILGLDRNDWESYLISCLQLIGFCIGKGFRLRAENKLETITEVTFFVKKLFQKINFKLYQRADWERGYALPENILPFIYHHISKFYLEFLPTELAVFIDDLLKRSKYQLGIYTEGYRECLYVIADEISKYKTHKALAFKVIKELDNHTQIAVQNRWERVPELLKVAELYARIGNSKKALAVYKKSLDASMGPTWYKESHFSLINTVLSMPKAGDCSVEHFRDFAGCLDKADGELTFQRYVRYNKQELISNLVQHGYIQQAVKYIQHQVLPDIPQIIDNTKSSKFDNLVEGEGYIQGTNTIILAAGIFQFLKHLKANPLIIWAISEAFVINDDIFRYNKDYAKIQSQCLNDLFQSNSPHTDEILNRLANIINMDEIADERSNYVKELIKYLNKNLLKNLSQRLTIIDINVPDENNSQAKELKPRKVRNEELDETLSIPGVGKLSNLDILYQKTKDARLELEMENEELALQHLSAGLMKMHQGKTDIWHGNGHSTEMRLALEVLSETGSPKEIILALKEAIINPLTWDWNVASSLIEIIQSKLNLEETNSIIEIVKEHLDIMIDCEPEIIAKYDWITDNLNNTENDKTAIRFLIWLLNHPHDKVKKRVMNSLLWLAKVYPQSTIKLLLDEALEEKALISTELSAYLLLEISQEQLDDIDKIFNKEYIEEIKSHKHFMIKYYFLQIGVSLNRIASKQHVLYNSLMSQFPETTIIEGDVFLEEDFLQPVEHLIYFLGNLEILNGRFCRDLLQQIDKYITPIGKKEYMKVDRYIRRSFHGDEVFIGNYEYLLRYSINNAITQRASLNNLEQIANILKLSHL